MVNELPEQSAVSPNLAYTIDDFRRIPSSVHGSLGRIIAIAIAATYPEGTMPERQELVSRYCEITGASQEGNYNMAGNVIAGALAALAMAKATERSFIEPTPEYRRRRSIHTIRQPAASKVLAYTGVVFDFGANNDVLLLSRALGTGHGPKTSSYLRYRLLADILTEEGQAPISNADRRKKLQLPFASSTIKDALEQLEASGVVSRVRQRFDRHSAWHVVDSFTEPLTQFITNVESLRDATVVAKRCTQVRSSLAEKESIRNLLITANARTFEQYAAEVAQGLANSSGD